jgi:hypothetical protein
VTFRSTEGADPQPPRGNCCTIDCAAPMQADVPSQKSLGDNKERSSAAARRLTGSQPSRLRGGVVAPGGSDIPGVRCGIASPLTSLVRLGFNTDERQTAPETLNQVERLTHSE